MSNPLPRSVGPRLYRIPDAARELAVSVRKVWRLIATGDLRTVRVGARGTRILASELWAYVDRLSKVQGQK
jgi:excisionase family DNA binding protein